MATVIFMGTPDFAVPTLQRLIDEHDVMGVVTQPDRPAGRKNKLRQPPVKELALKHNIPVFQPEKLRKKDNIQQLKNMGIPDVYIVAAYGQILPQSVLDIPAHGSINVHASLLPRWRGAAPIHAAIREGDAETGVTIMLMDAGLDTGPMLSKRAMLIEPDDTGQSLHDKLAALGADLLSETLPQYLNGDITPEPQDDNLSTLSPQIQKEEGAINWENSAESIERMVRAFTPWPGTYTTWDGKRLKILAGNVAAGSATPGEVTEKGGRVTIGTGEGLFVPTELQLAGSKAVSVTDFVNGHADFVGAVLGGD
ncbi:MAG: methionyl-tRNA formyltransferase [Chloroflexota bacterium]